MPRIVGLRARRMDTARGAGMSANRLLQAVSLPGAGMVRVTWSSEWSEYKVRASDAAGRMVAEYFTDDRGDAFGTANLMIDNLIKQGE